MLCCRRPSASSFGTMQHERLQHAAEHDFVGRHGALKDHMVANNSWRRHLSGRRKQTSSTVLKSTSSLQTLMPNWSAMAKTSRAS
jgi:hypothetical protein